MRVRFGHALLGAVILSAIVVFGLAFGRTPTPPADWKCDQGHREAPSVPACIDVNYG